jgi:hypothetical protein
MVNKNNPQIAGFKIKMSQGEVMRNITVINQSRKALSMTAFTFRFTADALIPVGA